MGSYFGKTKPRAPGRFLDASWTNKISKISKVHKMSKVRQSGVYLLFTTSGADCCTDKRPFPIDVTRTPSEYPPPYRARGENKGPEAIKMTPDRFRSEIRRPLGVTRSEISVVLPLPSCCPLRGASKITFSTDPPLGKVGSNPPNAIILAPQNRRRQPGHLTPGL